MSSNQQSNLKTQEEISAQVITDSVAAVADPKNSLPQPKGEDAIKMKETIEDKKADAQLGSGAKDQAVHFVKDSNNETIELDKETIKNVKTTVYFKNCKDGNFTISARITKVMIESCQRCTFNFKCRIFTNTIEAWKTVDCKVNILNDQVKTFQVDMTSRMNVTFDTRTSLYSIVWSGVNDMKLFFQDEPEFVHQTGFEQMKAQYSNQELSFTVDQFTTRIIKGELLTEQIIRLANGHITTEREANEFDNNEDLNKKRAEEFIRKRLAENGVSLGTTGIKKPEQDRNDVCKCGSGKKFKKCCGVSKN
ncbi:hypothetical protein DICPUDRAFT_95216 [Dictyostelium purpureum]|uniref:Adenylate cyclase-associated CAP C-terminal domain-containing protein n=1 Tax=Dictyostelium purpureum TaxID=5786 RepID=F0ZTN8_DICPU|nr:uncharacterized protein DICPUDRAFT_95216 [Dictyostelium purpureum]EGC32679.1 hypothetical protein DICPUDRAFT_95216 [Dictyostelium purpureum]|eukprot:XP_003290782.1 hypothetical protein DICPUDRAFT_95216 [Dictyostelium purpureum]